MSEATHRKAHGISDFADFRTPDYPDITGHPVTERAPKTTWCWFCHRALRLDDDDAIRVMIGFSTEWMCGKCYENSDPQVPLDYTEERDEHEGEPEFNGAFNRW